MNIYVIPIDPNKKIRLIYYNKFKTSNLIISNNSSPSTEFLLYNHGDLNNKTMEIEYYPEIFVLVFNTNISG